MNEAQNVDIRLLNGALSQEDRAFFGMPSDAASEIIWPENCAFTGNDAQTTFPLHVQKKRVSHRFEIPASLETVSLAKKNYAWIPSTGLWLAYGGVIGFFIVLYFNYSFSTQGNGGNRMFFWGLLAAAISFFGFYFVKVMQQVNPEFRQWCQLPGVKAKILKGSPYYTDIRFTFLRSEYTEAFKELNAEILRDKLRSITLRKTEDAMKAAEDGNPRAKFEAALAQERIGNADQAITLFNEALEADSELYEAKKHIAANQLWLNRTKLARRALEEYLQTNQSDSEALLLLASVCEQIRDFDQAAELYKQVIEDNCDLEVLERAADLAFHTRKFESAQSYLEKAISQAPNAFILRAKLLEVLLQAGDSSALNLALEKAVNDFPERGEEIQRRYGIRG